MVLDLSQVLIQIDLPPYPFAYPVYSILFFLFFRGIGGMGGRETLSFLFRGLINCGDNESGIQRYLKTPSMPVLEPLRGILA